MSGVPVSPQIPPRGGVEDDERNPPSAPPFVQAEPIAAPIVQAEPIAEPIVQAEPIAEPLPPLPAPTSPAAGGAPAFPAAPGGVGVRAFEQIASQDGIWLFQHRRNKLRVCLAPTDSNGVAALSIVYLIGSKCEVTGMTGSAHLLEHMYVCVEYPTWISTLSVLTICSLHLFISTLFSGYSRSFPISICGRRWGTAARGSTPAPPRTARNFTASCRPRC
jgi:hypothetical protein